MRRGLRTGPLLLALLILVGSAAPADEILLVDGRKIVGEIVEENADSVTVKVPYGTFRLPRKRILSITRQDKFQYHLVQGDHFASRGQLEVAIAEYRRALEIKPDDKVAKQKYFGAVGRLGRRYLSLKRHSEARKVFEKLLEEDPGNLTAKSGLRELEEQLAAVEKLLAQAGKLSAAGRPGEAIGSLEEAVELAPERRGEISEKLALAYRQLADQLYAGRRFTEAEACFTRAVALKPDLAPEIEGRFISSVLPSVAEAIRSEDLKLARKRLSRLAEFAPTDPRVLYFAGTIHAKEGQLGPAAVCLSRALGREWRGQATAESVTALHEQVRTALGGKTLKLDKPFRERYADSEPGDWKRLESDRFVAFHHNEKLARLVLQSAEYYVDRVLSNLSLPESVLWKEKCPIYIYRDAKGYREASGQAEWSGGVSSVRSAGGKLISQKVLTYQTAPKLLNSVLPHELAHLVFMSAIGYSPKFPLALHEGVAVYNELAFRRSYYRGVLTAHLKTETTLPLAEFFALKAYPAKPELF
ncbi:MAG: tetratricopeptide repeat protein, partial [Planctomycetota bacterium]